MSEPIAGEIQSVLTTARGDVLTVGAVFAVYFASSGVESLRIGLNRAYGLVEPRPWWLLRLESIGYVLVGAVGLLALAFLSCWPAGVQRGADVRALARSRSKATSTFGRFAIATVVLTTSLLILHMWLPAGRRQFARRLARHYGDVGRCGSPAASCSAAILPISPTPM